MFNVTLYNAKKTLQFLYDQHGKDYIWAVENDNLAPEDIKGHDCSEMSQKAYRLYMNISITDGSYNQYEYFKKHGKEIYYPIAKVQPLDLLFLKNKALTAIDHVAIVFGNMEPIGGAMLIEARGSPYRKVIFTPLDRMLMEFHARFAGIYRIINING